ncbi:MAG: hypothetical protein HWQ38_38970 [Nostoc sp. NMS7]|nr:hypothetical protein [Nostoc sp. NMS7]
MVEKGLVEKGLVEKGLAAPTPSPIRTFQDQKF